MSEIIRRMAFNEGQHTSGAPKDEMKEALQGLYLEGF